MKYSDLSSSVAARLNMQPEVFDSLPESVQHTMVTMAEQAEMLEHEKAAAEAMKKTMEQEKEALEQKIEETRHIVLEHERRQAQEERRLRLLEVSQRYLRESGFVGGSVREKTARTRMNKVEMGLMDISCEFPDREPYPVSHLGGRILGFRRSTIEALVPEIQELWNKALKVKNVQRSASGYMLFHLWTANQKRAGTHAIALTENIMDDVAVLYVALEELLQGIEKVKAGYESIFSGDQVSYIHFYLRTIYYPQPKCVSNWGSVFQEIEQRECFDIFTANDSEVNCVLQVARRLWGPEAKENTIEAIIQRAHGKVCILKPHSHVRHFQELNKYSDLVPELQSPVKNFSILDPNCVYLLHYNEHVGLLEKMKEQRRSRYVTSFRPMLKYPKTKKVTMCFDIECYFDTRGDTRHVPYLCCACFVYDNAIGNIVEFEGNDCIAQMLYHAADTVGEFGLKHIELIAHNGGTYDFHYLLTRIWDPSEIKNILMRNNRFISFDFAVEDVRFSVKDSFNFIGCSLQSAAKAFLNETDRKTDFPHHEVKTASDLQKILQEWISVDRELHVDIEKEKMMVKYENVIRYDPQGKKRSLMEFSKTYCTNDVLVLAKVWIRFKQTVSQVFQCEIVDQTYTLAGLSFRLFEANLPTSMPNYPHPVQLHHPIKEEYNNMRKSLVGGRCISVNGLFKDVVCLDVKSLYPAAMAYYDQPYGAFRKVTEEIPEALGIFYCRVEPVKVGSHGFFPLKKGKDVCYSAVAESYEEWYTSVDIQMGREEGHTITVIPFIKDEPFVGYSWKHKGKIFTEYIEQTLYRLKLLYEQTDQKEHRHVIKIIMNAIWGKFAQGWYDNRYQILDESMREPDDTAEWHKIFDTDLFVVISSMNKTIGDKPLQNGIFTLSWARYHMYLLWKHVVKPGTKCLYSDTDSMMILAQDLIKEATFELNGKTIPVIGDKMGQLEIEHTFSELVCVGKKQYMGKYGKEDYPKYKKRFKGVPQDYIVPQMYTHLLKSPHHRVEVEFLKFKREWGCVRGYMETKTLKQT
jgi:hypothetical protein